MKGEKLRAVLEDVDGLGLLVLKGAQRSFAVRNADGSSLAFYDTTEDGAFRYGYVEMAESSGRTDAIDWPTFYDLIRSRAKKPRRP
jgi:hypothetical protein